MQSLSHPFHKTRSHHKSDERQALSRYGSAKGTDDVTDQPCLGHPLEKIFKVGEVGFVVFPTTTQEDPGEKISGFMIGCGSGRFEHEKQGKRTGRHVR